jgi:hypothetical protein
MKMGRETLLVCDECRFAKAEDHAVNWIEVRTVGGAVAYEVGQKPPDGIYCSPMCLSKRVVTRALFEDEKFMESAAAEFLRRTGGEDGA